MAAIFVTSLFIVVNNGIYELIHTPVLPTPAGTSLCFRHFTSKRDVSVMLLTMRYCSLLQDQTDIRDHQYVA